MKKRFLRLSLVTSLVSLFIALMTYSLISYHNKIEGLDAKLLDAIKIYEKTNYQVEDVRIIKDPKNIQSYLIKDDFLVRKTKDSYSIVKNIDGVNFLAITPYSTIYDSKVLLTSTLILMIILFINYNVASFELKNFKRYLDNSARMFGSGKKYDDPVFEKGLRDDFRHLNNLSNNLKEKVRELDKERAKLDKIISNMIQGIILLDGKEKVILANDNAKLMLNLKNNLMGKDLLDELFDDYLVYKINDFTLNNLDNETFTYDMFDTKGIIYDIRLSRVKASWIDDVTHVGYLIVITDVTDTFMTNKIRADFIQNASHELKTPITAIRGYSEILMEDLVDETMIKEIYQKINYNSIKMANLISDILDLSKLERASINLKEEEVNLSSLIKEIIFNYDEKIQAKKLKVSLNFEDNMTLNTDKSIISIVLSNIISNGIKYNKIGGTLEISISKINNHLEIKIKDSGIGISKDNIERIFERFYRVNYDISGTGLGLSIVKHSLSLINGSIKINSEVNKYSEFILTF